MMLMSDIPLTFTESRFSRDRVLREHRARTILEELTAAARLQHPIERRQMLAAVAARWSDFPEVVAGMAKQAGIELPRDAC